MAEFVRLDSPSQLPNALSICKICPFDFSPSYQLYPIVQMVKLACDRQGESDVHLLVQKPCLFRLPLLSVISVRARTEKGFSAPNLRHSRIESNQCRR